MAMPFFFDFNLNKTIFVEFLFQNLILNLKHLATNVYASSIYNRTTKF